MYPVDRGSRDEERSTLRCWPSGIESCNENNRIVSRSTLHVSYLHSIIYAAAPKYAKFLRVKIECVCIATLLIYSLQTNQAQQYSTILQQANTGLIQM